MELSRLEGSRALKKQRWEGWRRACGPASRRKHDLSTFIRLWPCHRGHLLHRSQLLCDLIFLFGDSFGAPHWARPNNEIRSDQSRILHIIFIGRGQIQPLPCFCSVPNKHWRFCSCSTLLRSLVCKHISDNCLYLMMVYLQVLEFASSQYNESWCPMQGLKHSQCDPGPLVLPPHVSCTVRWLAALVHEETSQTPVSGVSAKWIQSNLLVMPQKVPLFPLQFFWPRSKQTKFLAIFEGTYYSEAPETHGSLQHR